MEENKVEEDVMGPGVTQYILELHWELPRVEMAQNITVITEL